MPPRGWPGVIVRPGSTSLAVAEITLGRMVMTPDKQIDLSTAEGRRAVGERIPAPEYDRGQLEVGIVHIGVGGFHRAHQAIYLDRLLSDPETRAEALRWGICGVDLMPGDKPKKALFTAQDGLYTLVVKNPDGSTEPRVIGSIARYLYAPDEPERVLATMADPGTRIVSLTVTEGGYNFNQVTGEFEAASPDIQEDLQPGATPRTVFGFVTEALRRRRAAGVPPFTVMSCDNLPGNGDIARRMFGAFADLADPELGAWLRAEVAFPNCMVDRITPVTTPGDIEQLEQDFGIRDGLTVVCEPFTQWVLQDEFPIGRPPWERAGVQLVDNVVPYELMKLRLLNASHQAIAYAGYLAGYHYAHEVAADPVFAEFLLGYMQREGRPTLPEVPGVDLDDYITTLLERFANPAIRDTLARLAAYSSDRIPKWLVPVIKANLARGGPVTRSAAVVAAWARYAEGVDESGQPIEVVDLRAEELMSAARKWSSDRLAFIRNKEFFADLAQQPAFTEAYLSALESLHAVGALATITELDERLR
jgi:mannitol 2-dehydrogenase